MREPRVPSRDERQELARRIAGLSSNLLRLKENREYIALQVGTPPYCNAVSLAWRKDRVGFYIASTDLLSQAVTAGFEPRLDKTNAGLRKHKYNFYGLKPTDLQQHEPLFSSIIKGSMDFVLSQKPKGR